MEGKKAGGEGAAGKGKGSRCRRKKTRKEVNKTVGCGPAAENKGEVNAIVGGGRGGGSAGEHEGHEEENERQGQYRRSSFQAPIGAILIKACEAGKDGEEVKGGGKDDVAAFAGVCMVAETLGNKLGGGRSFKNVSSEGG